MAKARVFVSSTYYDLKHVRTSLEAFIESLGYESILSEKGTIAYAPDIPLDESCYREVRSADIFVLIIGGRYGTERSGEKITLPKDFFTRYDSITKQEYKSAVAQDIPIYILIERYVYSDYETFLRNKSNSSINYAHVDSINIFHLIEEILTQPRNNPIQQFDRYDEIEAWLRDQWAGLFRELLSRMSSQKQLSSLSTQVANLAEVNKTLKTYLEEVVSKVVPKEAAGIIQKETKRLDQAKQIAFLSSNDFVKFLERRFSIDPMLVGDALLKSDTTETFFERLVGKSKNAQLKAEWPSLWRDRVTHDLNKLRSEFHLVPLTFDTEGAPMSFKLPKLPLKTKTTKKTRRTRTKKATPPNKSKR